MEYKTNKYGTLTLLAVGDNTYEVYDAEIDTYRGTIHRLPIDEDDLELMLDDIYE